MKKIAEKVALVAIICITLVFVITAVLYITGTLNNYGTTDLYDENGKVVERSDNSIVLILMLVLGVLYLALAAYLLYVNFSDRSNLKQILLFCDSNSATRTNIKVINNIVKGCSQQVDGLKVRKVHVRADEKGGFIAVVAVKVDAENVSENVNKLRCLLVDSFKNTLNLTFNTINFQVEKLNGKYAPDVAQAEKQAEALQENQEAAAENYLNPMEEAAESDLPETEPAAATEAQPAAAAEEPAAEPPVVEKELEAQE